MQIKRNPVTGAHQQWINGELVREWGSRSDPDLSTEEMRRLLQSAIDLVSKGRIHIDLSSEPKGEPK